MHSRRTWSHAHIHGTCVHVHTLSLAGLAPGSFPAWSLEGPSERAREGGGAVLGADTGTGVRLHHSAKGASLCLQPPQAPGSAQLCGVALVQARERAGEAQVPLTFLTETEAPSPALLLPPYHICALTRTLCTRVHARPG